MNEESARRFLSYLGSESFSRSGHYLNGQCPFAPWRHTSGKDSNPSFGVRLDQPEPHYFCFSCGSSGGLPKLIMELTHLCGQNDHMEYDLAKARELLEAVENDIEIREWEDPQFGFTTMNVIPEWWLDTFAPAIAHSRAVKYLEKRGISVGVAHLLNLRYDTQRDVVGFPARDFDGHLVGMRGRRVELEGDEPSDFPRFHEYKYQGVSNSGDIWLGEHLVDLSRPVVVVEGNFDYARVFGVYSNVVAAQTASVSMRKAQRLMGAWSLVLMLDNDMAGKHGANRLRSVLGAECVIQEVMYPEGYKDPGSLPESEISGMLSPFI